MAKATKKSKLPMAKPELASVAPSRESAAQEQRWKAESALRTINEAEKYKKDANLMKNVKALAKEQVNDLKKICK